MAISDLQEHNSNPKVAFPVLKTPRCDYGARGTNMKPTVRDMRNRNGRYANSKVQVVSLGML